MKISQNDKVNSLLQALETTDPIKYELMQALRMLVLDEIPTIEEKVMYGGILFSNNGEMFSGIFAYKNHVSMEFGNGYLLKDIYHSLDGKGKFRRHIKLSSNADIGGKHIIYYVKQALKVKQ
ncbi:MAG: DUF1801 domain-containing protein [Saprospiraceae bacterium]|nr:DUF1801 domain-containing protein [Saprospiraceae bacterium]